MVISRKLIGFCTTSVGMCVSLNVKQDTTEIHQGAIISNNTYLWEAYILSMFSKPQYFIYLSMEITMRSVYRDWLWLELGETGRCDLKKHCFASVSTKNVNVNRLLAGWTCMLKAMVIWYPLAALDIRLSMNSRVKTCFISLLPKLNNARSWAFVLHQGLEWSFEEQ